MSIIIKGMEMPKNCVECPIRCLCLFYTGRVDIRNQDCPITEIKEPHGRLGDLNALQEQIKLNVQDAHMGILWKQGMAYAHGLVEASKTVIEAEGETE